MSDLIRRADAIEAVHKYFVKEIDKTPHEIDEDGDDVYTDMTTVNSLLACNKELSKALKALPSAETDMSEYADRLWKIAYERGKAEAEPKDRLIKMFAENLTAEEIAKGEEYAKGYADGLKDGIDTDAVSREEYEEVKAYMDTLVDALIEDGEEIAELKEKLESTDSMPRWIPCSEKLPRTGDDILVTFSDGEVDIVISARPKAWVQYEEANNLIFPVAWMPLPKPYREDGEEE